MAGASVDLVRVDHSQASEDTQLHFVRTMWPEFGLSDLLPILLGWQQKMWLRGIGC